MSTGGAAIPEHAVRTRNRELRYLFHTKHHVPGRPRGEVAQWRIEVTREQEFGVFDLADDRDTFDPEENLYGVALDDEGEVLELGTDGQQVAFFPNTRPEQPWHGYPLAPLKRVEPPHPPKREVPREVLRRMVEVGMLDEAQRKRLMKGKQA